MTASLFQITGRTRAHGAEAAALAQFKLSPGEEVNPDILTAEPDWSLYALDVDAGMAVFTELPPDTDLSAAPFVYQVQFEQARRLATLPLGEFETLAAGLPLPEKLVFLFSTGRAGSTLASRILGQVPGVWSLSEPDAFTNLAMARFRLGEVRTTRLLGAAARIVCRPPAGTDVVAIKPRSQASLQMPLYARALPQARFAYLYRDATGYVNSASRFVQRLLGPENYHSDPDVWKIAWPFSAIGAPYELLDEWFETGRDSVDHVDTATLGWVLRMDGYLGALDLGVALVPIHYDDLNTDRPAHTLRLLEACGIDVSHLETALHGFDRDAQAGSAGTEVRTDRPLNDAERARIAGHLRRWNRREYKDERLPGSTPG